MSDEIDSEALRYIHDPVQESEAQKLFLEKLSPLTRMGAVPEIPTILREAKKAGISDDEVMEIFSEPLPKDDDDAKNDLRDRLVGLFERIDHRQTDIEARLSFGIQQIRNLYEYHKKISNFKPVLSTYRALINRLDWDPKILNLISGKVMQWDDITGDNFGAILETDAVQALLEANCVENMEAAKEDEDLVDLLEDVQSYYSQLKEIAEDLIHKQFPWVRKQVAELKNISRALELFTQIPREHYMESTRELLLSDLDIEELKKDAGCKDFRGNVWLNNLLDEFHYKKHCDIKLLASYVSKTGKVGKRQAQVKAVKRKFRGLIPAGVEGVDYKIEVAQQSHVNDGTARKVGDIVVSFINSQSNPTKFHTKDVIRYIHLKEIIGEVETQLKKELGHKPTPEEVAHEMDLPVEKIWRFTS